MREIKIYSKNSTFQRFEVLKRNRNKRYKYNEFLVEGVRSLKEAVNNQWNIKSLLYADGRMSDWAKGMIDTVKTEVNYCLTPELMKELSEKEDTSELMAVIEMREDSPDSVTLSKNPLIVLFDRPSNKGTLCVCDFLLDFAIMDLNKPYLMIPEKLYEYFKKNGMEVEHFHERFLCMAYYKGIATLMWHASIDDEESCLSIMKSISELEERIRAIK